LLKISTLKPQNSHPPIGEPTEMNIFCQPFYSILPLKNKFYMKHIFGILSILLLSFTLVNAQSLVNPEKLPDSALNFMVASDMGRKGVSEQKNVAELLGKEADYNKISFIAVAGDPIHDDGVKSTEDTEWKDKFENIYTAASLMNIPWYVVSGNHEYHGSVQAILDYSKVSSRWKAPARYYTIEKNLDERGNKCLLIFIDTAPLIDKYREENSYSDAGKQNIDKQLKWLDSTLVSTKDRWKIVIGHHPVYAETKKEENERTDMQKRVGVILENRRADLYICGHIHNFQHIKPEGKTVNYVVNSSASESRKVNKMDGTIFCNPDPGFTVCSVTQESFTFFFINNKGENVYKYVMKK
jgi:DNA repair exonuclease SbcCD nuclease subunit